MNRILIVRLGALGDIVHAIPVAAAIRRALPAARIDWLVSAKHRDLVDLVPAVDRRIAIGKASRGDGMTLLGAIRAVRRERYDAAIDLQGLLKSALLARGSGAARVVGFASSYLRERLARPFYSDVYDPGCSDLYDPRETRHVIEINLALLQQLGITAAAPEFPIRDVESAVAREVREQAGDRYALLNPGAAWPNKRWPAARIGQLAAALFARHRLKSVVLSGDASERLLADEAVAQSGGAAVTPARASIADLVALARGAAVMVSGDTGPTHIAAAVGTPVVAIFGPTRPSRNGPWSPDDVTVSRSEVCQCHHLRECKAGTMCLTSITVDEVLEAVERRLCLAGTPSAR